MSTSRALIIAETAKRLACSTDTVRALISSKRLHAVNLSQGSRRAKWVVPESEIERFLEPPAPSPSRRRRSRSVESVPRRY